MERAFEVHAVDYLRKPYTNARFASALAHARRRVKARRAEASTAVTSDASTRSQLAPILASVRGERSDTRIALRDVARSTWHIIDPDEIDWVEGEGASRVRVHVGAESYVWKKTLTALEHSLDPRHFMRIHRSHLVNTRRIRHVKQLQKGEYAVVLTDETVLDTGRTYRARSNDSWPGRGEVRVSEKPTLVVSRIHIGAVPPETERAFRAFLVRAFLYLAGAEAASLVISGDLFDNQVPSRRLLMRRYTRSGLPSSCSRPTS